MPAEIWIRDLAARAPGDAISRAGATGTWIAVDYEVQEGPGVMLLGLPGDGPPPLTLPLRAEGWHQVRLGVYYGSHAGALVDRMLLARLSGDAAYTRIGREPFRADKDGDYPEKVTTWSDIAEVYWKSADLTGQDLVIAHPPRGAMAGRESCLAWVRLVPMDRAAVRSWRARQPTADTRRLITNYDGGSISDWGLLEPGDFLDEFQALRDSDVDIALWAVARGPITFYPSSVGELVPERHGMIAGPAVRRCVEAGVDPLRAAIDAARQSGLRLFPQNRLQGPQLPPQHLRSGFGGQFLADHPEWMALYADGEPTRHLSFAFPGVRDLHVRLMREWVQDYVADGVNVLFSRSYPFAYYEEPVARAFRAEYGEDMRRAPPSDVRAQRVRAAFVTQFLREVRYMLDEVGAAQDRHIPSCYLVPVGNSPPGLPPVTEISALDECLFNGLDVATWIAEGLVDYLVVHLHVYGQHDGTAWQDKIREFAALARGTGTRIVVDVYPRRMPPRQYRRIAMSYYDAGADGLSFWDSHGRHYRASEWAFLRRLGHRDELLDWQGVGDDNYRVVPLTRLDGFAMGREFSGPTDG